MQRAARPALEKHEEIKDERASRSHSLARQQVPDGLPASCGVCSHPQRLCILGAHFVFATGQESPDSCDEESAALVPNVVMMPPPGEVILCHTLVQDGALPAGYGYETELAALGQPVASAVAREDRGHFHIYE